MGELNLNSLQFVVGENGRPSAVQLNMADWQALIEWLEYLEDRALVEKVASKFKRGPALSGALRWEDVMDQWNSEQPE